MRLKRVCPMCGGDGWTRENPLFCPLCKTKATEFKPKLIEEQNSDDNSYNLLLSLQHKPKYTKQGMANLYKPIVNTPKYKQFTGSVGYLLNTLVQGQKLTTNFAFGCSNMNVLEGIANASLYINLKNGRTAFPYIDSLTLYSMSTNPSIEFSGLHFYDVVDVDLLCIYAETSMEIYKTFDIVTRLIKARGLRGKATVIFLSQSLSSIFSNSKIRKFPSTAKFQGLFSDNPVSLYQIGYTELFVK